jgi:hypothetical protein
MPDTEEKLAELVRHLIVAKQTEEKAKEVRISYEEKIAALVPGPDRGQVTQKLEGGTSICVERGFNYKADIDGLNLLCVGENFPPIKTKTTHELDVAGYEWYRTNKPDFWSQMACHVKATPKKISVTVKAAK